MGAQAYTVSDYSWETFVSIIAEFSSAPPQFLQSKRIIKYFHEYFSQSGVNVKTIICENHYIDRDYLEDYAGFYAKCYTNYKKHCRRLHFFSKTINDTELKKLLRGEIDEKINLKQLKDAYCGFIVIKPLPRTMIGKTCLKTYDCDREDGSRRHYVKARSYDASLFGLPLTIKDTVAFQEQDSVAAACATSALWTVFQATGQFFQHHIPSPIQVTQAATVIPELGRSIPQEGLSLKQMMLAVKSIGLDVYTTATPVEELTKAQIHAFIKCGIPLTLAVEIHTGSLETGAYWTFQGYHAVVVTGFNIDTQSELPDFTTPQGSSILLRSSRIKKIYVHDDGVGPFARMEFDRNKITLQGPQEKWSLSTSWEFPDTTTRMNVTHIIFAHHEKIRITYTVIYEIICLFNHIIVNENWFSPIEWEIFLTTLNHYKQEVLADSDRNADSRETLLTTSMPKYIWRVVAWNRQGKRIFECLFDATDFALGHPFLHIFPFDWNTLQPMILNCYQACNPKDTQAKSDFEELQTQMVWKLIEAISALHRQ
ncbi:MAG: hypothetical protein HQM03_21740 [Magnetococcales bacterium]|nr:hypothetical protein [Magnetococcales bacterium]